MSTELLELLTSLSNATVERTFVVSLTRRCVLVLLMHLLILYDTIRCPLLHDQVLESRQCRERYARGPLGYTAEERAAAHRRLHKLKARNPTIQREQQQSFPGLRMYHLTVTPLMMSPDAQADAPIGSDDHTTHAFSSKARVLRSAQMGN